MQFSSSCIHLTTMKVFATFAQSRIEAQAKNLSHSARGAPFRGSSFKKTISLVLKRCMIARAFRSPWGCKTNPKQSVETLIRFLENSPSRTLHEGSFHCCKLCGVPIDFPLCDCRLRATRSCYAARRRPQRNSAPNQSPIRRSVGCSGKPNLDEGHQRSTSLCRRHAS